MKKFTGEINLTNAIFCEKHFMISENKKSHEKIHTDVKEFKCEFCDKCFIDLQYMKMHQRTHVRRDEYKCDLCDKKFDRIQSLNRHKKRIHKENLSYTNDF